MDIPSPQELDAQSTTYLSGWLDLGSQRWRSMDDDPELTKEWLRLLLDDGLFTDTLGRVWGKGKFPGIYEPYHIECLGKCYGIRIPSRAKN